MPRSGIAFPLGVDKEFGVEKHMKPFELLTSPLDGTNLIEASAGTGKTYTIAALYLRLILEKNLVPEQVLVVTFTEAATKELRDRIRRKLRDAVEAFEGGAAPDTFVAQLVDASVDRESAVLRLKESLRAFDRAAVFTIHGFCQRTLHENAFESGGLFDTELVTTQDNLKREIVEDFWRTHFYQAEPQVVRYALTHGYGPDVFFKLVEMSNAFQSDLKVLPDCSPPSSAAMRGPIEELIAGVERLEEMWQTEKTEILGQLASPGLKASSLYRSLDSKSESGNRSERELKIEGLVQDMEDYFIGKDPAVPLPLSGQFEAFTRRKLESSTKKSCMPPRHDFFDLCDKVQDLAADVRQVMESYFLHLKREVFQYMNSELPLRKQHQNIQHFDDLLLRLKEGLEKAGSADLAAAVRNKYRAALIDEFQDTDPIQYAIFYSLFGGPERSLFLIGDPKQAIYSFRGADIFTYMKAAGNADRTYTLGTNWRSDPHLITAVNTLFDAPPHNPFVYPEIPFRPVSAVPENDKRRLILEGRPQPALDLWFLRSDRVSAGAKPIRKEDAQSLIRNAVVAEMTHLLRLGASGKALIGGRPLREGDFAVLVRTNREAREVKEALSAANIPSVLYSTEDVFDTPEAEELQRVLLAIAQPQREGLVRAALATDIMGATGEDLARWLREEARWEEWIGRFRSYLDSWNSHGFMRMFRQFMVEQRVRSRLLSLINGERRITNVLHISEVLHQESVERRLGVAELLAWVVEQRDPQFRGTQERQLRLECDENAVRLVTVHKSKGLEYPIVFCPFSWGASGSSSGSAPLIFHDENDGRRVTLDLGSTERDVHRKYAEKESLAENIRLLYVALTRAQTRCYLAWGRFNTAETSAPAYLFHYGGNPDAVDVVGDMAKSWKEWTDDGMWEQLQAIAARGRGSIRLAEMDLEKAGVYSLPESDVQTLSCRRFQGTIERDWRVSSFSALTHNLPRGAELPDRDESDQPDPEGLEETQSLLGAAGEGLDIFDFPRGQKAGTLLHDILEHLDFTTRDSDVLNGVVNQKLMEHGFDPSWQEVLCAAIRKVLSIPLGEDGEIFTLAEITSEERLNELEFYFPLRTLTAERLRSVFEEFTGGAGEIGGVVEGLPRLWQGSPRPFEVVPPKELISWTEQLGRLQFQPVRGFIRGFMDLVFRFRGRFYLVDWKSNYLGNRVRDYSPHALTAVMQREYYVLQYFLYTVALDRYLAMRLESYEYDRHFGGVYYLFLRGVDPERGDRCGIFHDRPPHDLIQALSVALGVG